jgi:hypothetical protein
MVTAGQLAHAYDLAVSARWRGEEDTAGEFMRWLSAFWVEAATTPETDPVAVSPLGAGGRGIRWYDTAPVVVGRVPGLAGGYLIPQEVAMPPASTWPLATGMGTSAGNVTEAGVDTLLVIRPARHLEGGAVH